MHLQRLSVLFHSRRSVGDTIARVAATPTACRSFVTGAALPLLQSSLTLTAMLFVMWRLDPTMTLLALAVAPLMGISIWLFSGPMYERNRKRRDLEGEMMSVLEQTLAAIPAVQAFTREDVESARFRRLADRTVAEYRRATDAEMAFKLCVGLVTALGTAGLMWSADARCSTARSPWVRCSSSSPTSRPYTSHSTSSHTASTLQTAAANADRVMEMFDASPDVATVQTHRTLGSAAVCSSTPSRSATKPRLRRCTTLASTCGRAR
jgi:ABC-type multidrug transport system fused ATPase/permease subunit